jgi:hypothetical protein
MNVELTTEEIALLRELLNNAHQDLREEVYKTEATDWKRALKERDQVLQGLLTKLTSS